METKIYVSDDIGEKWKELAMKRFGYGRGSISKAAEEALYFWVNREEKIRRMLDDFVSIAKSEAHVSVLMLFGSYARKERYNDIDVAVVVDESVGNRERFSIITKFEERVPDDIKADISVFNPLGLDVKSRILSEGVMLYVRNKEDIYDISSEIIRQNADFGVAMRSALGV